MTNKATKGKKMYQAGNKITILQNYKAPNGNYKEWLILFPGTE